MADNPTEFVMFDLSQAYGAERDAQWKSEP